MNNKMTRFLRPVPRAWLACLALALCAPLAACNAPAGDVDTDTVAPVSELPVAAQMYTLRDAGTLAEQFAIVREAGIGAVELVGDHGISADEMNALLAEHGLEVASAHVGIDALRSDIGQVIAFHRAVGNDTLVIPWLAESERPADAAGWRALGGEIGALARRLEADGLRLGYHNHEFEMQAFDGVTALELLLDAAGPGVLAEVDLAWVARGGLDPADYLSRFQGRLFAVHAKDNAPAGTAQDEGGFAIVGQGVLDWDAILPAAEAAGVTWYILEHDRPRDARAVLSEGHRFLRDRLVKQAAP